MGPDLRPEPNMSFILWVAVLGAVLLTLALTSSYLRWIGWFGIRGIGSLYDLFYALNHGITQSQASVCTDLTLSVVALSILIHGISTQPMLAHYERRNML